MSSLHPWKKIFRVALFIRRRIRVLTKTRKPSAPKGVAAAPLKRSEKSLGHYFLQGNRHQNGGLVVAPAQKVLANVFLDVLGEMGGHVVVVMGENLGRLQPLLSISPPVSAQWLQTLLSEYQDVLAGNHEVELSVQSVEKCCTAVLTPDKHIIMHACEPQRYVRALESRGLREVAQMPHTAHARKARRLHAEAAEETRLDELKQYLSVSSSVFSPQQEWLH